MDSKVLFTDSLDIEIDEAVNLSRGSARRFYVYSKEAAGDVDYLRMALPGFVFVALEETCASKNGHIFSGNSPEDFWVIKKPRLSNIMDRNIDMHQIMLKGRRLVVDSHPFLGKAQVFWCYFPYSFFDKSLLGYPHSYAFRDAKGSAGIDPFDCQMIARKVAHVSTCTKPSAFPEPLEPIQCELSIAEKQRYALLKERLFEEEDSIGKIIRGLRAYTLSCPSAVAMVPAKEVMLDLVNQNRVWGQYQAGARRYIVTDAAVDTHLEGELQSYVSSANTFFKELYCG